VVVHADTASSINRFDPRTSSERAPITVSPPETRLAWAGVFRSDANETLRRSGRVRDMTSTGAGAASRMPSLPSRLNTVELGDTSPLATQPLRWTRWLRAPPS
jgi:hypothetical protein